MPEKISFSLVQLKSGVTPLTSPNIITQADLGTTTAVTNRAYVAVLGDGDTALEAGETGHVLSGLSSALRMTNAATLNTAEDPVKITAHGRLSSTSVGNMAPDGRLAMSNSWGVGLDNGVESSGRFLNGGDSITWTLNAAAGVPQKLTALSFVVDMNGGTGPTEIAFDFDGNVLSSGSYAASQNAAQAETALRLAANGGDTVSINFEVKALTVNGTVRTGAAVDAFFAAYDTSPQNTVTIGGIGSAGFSVRDLTLDRKNYAGPPANSAPVVTLENVIADLPGNTDTTAAVKIADIVIQDDGVGKNVLSLSGADAGLFQITGSALYLKAGAVLDRLANPTLDVAVGVDDAAINGSPESTAALGVTVTPNTDDRITFALVQLKSGVTPASSANEIGPSSLGTTIFATNRAYVAIVGDGDQRLEGGESAFVLSGMNFSSRMSASATLSTVADPVKISAHGRQSTTTVGTINPDGTVAMSNAWGIGLDNGAESTGRYLNSGDSITWTLNDKGGVPQSVAGFRFAVDMNGATGPGEVAIDFDGDVIRTGSYGSTQTAANAEAALRLAVNGGDVVAVDLASKAVTVNGVARSGAAIDAFFAAHEAGPQNVLTLGSITGNGFSVRDLLIDRMGPVVNLPPTLSLTGALAEIAENTVLADPLKVVDIIVTDDGKGTNALGLTGADAALFQITQGALYLKAGVALDFETRSKLDVTVTVEDAAIAGGPEGSVPYSLAVTDVNEAPKLALGGTLTTLADTANLTQPLKVADILLTDDALGTNAVSLTGADAGLFEITGNALYLKAGTVLDFQANPVLDVQVDVDDAALGTGPEAQASLSIALTHVDPQVGPITLDGVLTDWTPGSRLDTALTGVPGYAVYGTYQSDSFVLALKTDGLAIGQNSTFWLNTDADRTTGYQVFGFAVGAEYHINIGADGKAALYTGGEFGTGPALALVTADLDYAFSPDRTVLEIALPSALMDGAPRRAEVYADVNDTVNLPTSYGEYSFVVGESAPLLPKAADTRVAVVYSETSANFYFDKTAYGQLFMSAQNQAMQAGLPFDVISESDLTNIATLAKYDALILPGLSHVQSADLAAITATLTTAVRDYGIGLVTMGNLLTNDQTGAPLAGDTYSRMKAIQGVALDGFGTTNGVVIKAVDGSHPVSDLYGVNEQVGAYSSASYLTFKDITGTGQTVFTQTVDGPNTDPATVAAVIATTNGAGRNVHFATDAVFGNNNILSEAINWVARGTAPDVGLQLTRHASLFYSRNDMDQSQEIFDVNETDPGIYDAMLPIVEKWYQDFGFVGSFYINVGANSPDQRTDWAVSKPHYDQLMAMGNEIGTHSYTHPENTNLLLPDTFTEAQRQAWLSGLPSGSLKTQLSNLTLEETQSRMTAALALTDPKIAGSVDAMTLGALDKEILKASYRFQFEYSKLIIERELGISIDGAAVPGAPEKLAASLDMLQHLGYLSGGYAGIGAGYPGAFGFLSPDNKDQVYFAPNLSFDFSLIGFRNLTIPQAEAVWAEEYAAIVTKGTAPILHFPWHDYGPTNWPDGSGADPGYNLQMFTTFLARAAADGTEFVTGADLAQRIEAFAASSVEISTNGAKVVAKVTGADLGKFALDVAGGQVIESVDGWYAYDANKLFLPRAGGTFEILLGTQATDVTHITSLPMRADLISAAGNGTDLSFVIDGIGAVTVDLKAWGAQSVIATGADSGRLSGEVLTLSFATAGSHSMEIGYTGSSQVTGTAGRDVVIGSDLATRIDGLQGNDTLTGGGGADTFVFRAGSGQDLVTDFDPLSDVIDLVNSGFASVADALAAFAETAEGLVLQLGATDRLVLAQTSLGQLGLEDIRLTNEGLLL